jgi:hypothetical protein
MSAQKPNRTFPAVPSDLREWTRYLNALFFSREWTTTLLGCTTEPSGIARYTVSAGIVCLSLPSLSATSDEALCFLSNLPAEITPQHDQFCLASIIDNGITALGQVLVGIDTGITLYKGLDMGAFTSSGTKGLKSSILIYALD